MREHVHYGTGSIGDGDRDRCAAGERVTPAAAGTEKKGAPWFTVVFVIAGMLAAAYAMMRRRG